MKITSAEFIKSAFRMEDWVDDGKPEIAFLGRSNVGKSSLLNSLLLRKGLARTSNTPGRTQSINFFLINDGFYFVDLPGYGFAKVSKSMRADWGKMAEDYLSEREELSLSIQLVDSRYPPKPPDLMLHEWLKHHGREFVIVATKIDKLNSREMNANLKAIRSAMPGSEVIPYSSVKGNGREELWSKITSAIKKV
ncbi:MAG: ribosome biogenesis GTP-binding protein YihA/YsxC [Acidobacteria bacterium]|nr:ribosome biogenesis GTP-binding protein YihA/YsxC [Acidobacteriota bacterium]